MVLKRTPFQAQTTGAVGNILGHKRGLPSVIREEVEVRPSAVLTVGFVLDRQPWRVNLISHIQTIGSHRHDAFEVQSCDQVKQFLAAAYDMVHVHYMD